MESVCMAIVSSGSWAGAFAAAGVGWSARRLACGRGLAGTHGDGQRRIYGGGSARYRTRRLQYRHAVFQLEFGSDDTGESGRLSVRGRMYWLGADDNIVSTSSRYEKKRNQTTASAKSRPQ